MLALETLNGIFRPRIHNSPFPDCPDFLLSVSYSLLGVDGARTPAGAGGEIMKMAKSIVVTLRGMARVRSGGRSRANDSNRGQAGESSSSRLARGAYIAFFAMRATNSSQSRHLGPA
jgi:hypothetical protein